VHFPGSPTNVDFDVLNRPADKDAVSLFNLPTEPACRGGILPGEENLREGDMELLRGIWQILLKIGKTAKESGIKIAVDAEHSWYQPAIDGYTMLMSQEFNKIQPGEVANPATSPLIYGTYQAYLRRSDGHLAASLKHAKENNYTLGVKLVRGAYADQERKKWIDDGRAKLGTDPIQPNKEATHAAFNGATTSLIAQLAKDIKAKPTEAPSVGIFFGTHNGDSCDLIANSLVENDLAERNEEGRLVTKPGVRGRVCTGQLFGKSLLKPRRFAEDTDRICFAGMSDNLTEAVAAKFEVKGAPMVLKYLPYGSLKEVLPYLGRRAIENKSMLNGEGGASYERNRVMGEIRRRLGFA
jgi:proline dehydrogenase